MAWTDSVYSVCPVLNRPRKMVSLFLMALLLVCPNQFYLNHFIKFYIIIKPLLYYLQFYIFSQRNTYLDCLLVRYTCSLFYCFHIVALLDSNMHILAHRLFSKSFYSFWDINFYFTFHLHSQPSFVFVQKLSGVWKTWSA